MTLDGHDPGEILTDAFGDVLERQWRMMSSIDQELLKRLGDANDARAAVFVFMCAERVRPVVTVFGSACADAAVDAALDAVWRSLTEAVDASAIEQAICAPPEASVDDASDPSYYAMRALGLVVDAVHATRSVGADILASAGSGARDLAGDLRFHLRDLVGHDNRLDELENAAEIEAAERLGSLRPEDVASEILPLRELARQRASGFAEAARALAEAWNGHGWTA